MNVSAPLLKKFIADTNAAAQEAGIETVLKFLECADMKLAQRWVVLPHFLLHRTACKLPVLHDSTWHHTHTNRMVGLVYSEAEGCASLLMEKGLAGRPKGRAASQNVLLMFIEVEASDAIVVRRRT